MKTLNLILTAAIVALSFNCFAGNNNPMTGTYTIGKTAGSNFESVAAALTAVGQNGASGPVTFVVDKQVYNQQEIIAAIVNTPVNGNVEFISSGDQSNTADVSDDANSVGSK